MNRRRFTTRAGALACALALGATGAASANPANHTMKSTFPVASRLCNELRVPGTNHPHLRKYITQAIAACTALEATFNTATTSAIAAEAPIRTALASDHLAYHVKCATATAAARTVCKQTRTAILVDQRRLEIQRGALQRSYGAELTTARHTFWAAIHAIPGAKNLAADRNTTPVVP